jgi:hypothetical protein
MKNKDLSFVNQNAVPPPAPTKLAIVLNICSAVWTLVVAFAVIVFGCALLYLAGSKGDWGIIPTFTIASEGSTHSSVPEAGFLDCLHFSIVTIATLG